VAADDAWLGVFWVAVIWVVVTQLRGRSSGEQSARDILDRRLADGEISVEEYERRRDAMRAPSSHIPSHP
jgi:uncharacterized membrane protein